MEITQVLKQMLRAMVFLVTIKVPVEQLEEVYSAEANRSRPHSTLDNNLSPRPEEDYLVGQPTQQINHKITKEVCLEASNNSNNQQVDCSEGNSNNRQEASLAPITPFLKVATLSMEDSANHPPSNSSR